MSPEAAQPLGHSVQCPLTHQEVLHASILRRFECVTPAKRFRAKCVEAANEAKADAGAADAAVVEILVAD